MEEKVIYGYDKRISLIEILSKLKQKKLAIIICFLASISVIIIFEILAYEKSQLADKSFSNMENIFNNLIESQLLLYISLFLMILLILFLTMTYQEYQRIHYLRQEVLYTGHRMSLEEVFENENRKKIIEIILDEPGIHYNSLLRKSEISAGQLQWHINVLINFDIIYQKKVEGFLVYFATLIEDPKSQNRLFLIKSKTTLEIFTLIEENPGITSSDIAKEIKKSKSSINYNINKLRKKKLVKYQQQGRKKHLYVYNEDIQ